MSKLKLSRFCSVQDKIFSHILQDMMIKLYPYSKNVNLISVPWKVWLCATFFIHKILREILFEDMHDNDGINLVN